MDLGLEGQVAIAFGGASGIGRAIAEAFVAECATVVIGDLAPETQAVASSIGAASGLVADVTDLAAIHRVADSVFDRFGRCDHVVFAAGCGSGQFGMPFWNVDPGRWERVLRVNLVGAVHVAHAFAPRMAEARSGTFLFLGSIAGQIGSPTDPPYSAAKAGLINFAQCCARDLAPFNVRVNTLNPGMVQTPLNRSVWQAWADRQPEAERLSYEDWTAEKIRRMVPLNRWQEPEDLAAMAIFLASSRAKNVTGQTVNVDGGFVMHW
jgi:NAD(P)-dependent dehydrogenase (short-subunit alcohol dehydrogenase family)